MLGENLHLMIQDDYIGWHTDDVKAQKNVDIANAYLASLAKQPHIDLVNNDASFKLSDGTADDGYLLKDGLYTSVAKGPRAWLPI